MVRFVGSWVRQIRRLEMSYDSDLDLVFVRGIDPNQMTDGDVAIEGGSVNRVVRRVIA